MLGGTGVVTTELEPEDTSPETESFAGWVETAELWLGTWGGGTEVLGLVTGGGSICETEVRAAGGGGATEVSGR